MRRLGCACRGLFNQRSLCRRVWSPAGREWRSCGGPVGGACREYDDTLSFDPTVALHSRHTTGPAAPGGERVGKAQRQNSGKKKRGGSGILGWVIGIAVLGAIGFGLSQMSSVAFDEDDIRVVNFEVLNSAQKQRALQQANAARCTCGCGLGLAQCVATDPNCPIREGNIERIKGMVRQAQAESND